MLCSSEFLSREHTSCLPQYFRRQFLSHICFHMCFAGWKDRRSDCQCTFWKDRRSMQFGNSCPCSRQFLNNYFHYFSVKFKILKSIPLAVGIVFDYFIYLIAANLKSLHFFYWPHIYTFIMDSSNDSIGLSSSDRFQIQGAVSILITGDLDFVFFEND